jgi:hypothetical protein
LFCLCNGLLVYEVDRARLAPHVENGIISGFSASDRDCNRPLPHECTIIHTGKKATKKNSSRLSLSSARAFPTTRRLNQSYPVSGLLVIVPAVCEFTFAEWVMVSRPEAGF